MLATGVDEITFIPHSKRPKNQQTKAEKAAKKAENEGAEPKEKGNEKKIPEKKAADRRPPEKFVKVKGEKENAAAEKDPAGRRETDRAKHKRPKKKKSDAPHRDNEFVRKDADAK